VAKLKLKTNKGAAKRFRLTASGKVKCKHSYARHILTKKATKRKRNLRRPGYVSPVDAGRVARLIPYA